MFSFLPEYWPSRHWRGKTEAINKKDSNGFNLAYHRPTSLIHNEKKKISVLSYFHYEVLSTPEIFSSFC